MDSILEKSIRELFRKRAREIIGANRCTDREQYKEFKKVIMDDIRTVANVKEFDKADWGIVASLFATISPRPEMNQGFCNNKIKKEHNIDAKKFEIFDNEDQRQAFKTTFTSRYIELANRGLVIPDDEVFQVITGCSRSMGRAGRAKLVEIGWTLNRVQNGWIAERRETVEQRVAKLRASGIDAQRALDIIKATFVDREELMAAREEYFKLW